MSELTHLSLFTGIGGIDLAAEWAGFQTVGQVEKADYPYNRLCELWPDVPKWRDINDITGDEIRRVCGQPTLITGGFPCQPHSCAGKRKGSCDERDLWPALFRILSEIKPRWFVGENVPGLRASESGRFFGGVLRDLASIGYNVGWDSWEAADVGAPHHRERVFIVAYTTSIRREGHTGREPSGEEEERRMSEFIARSDVADTHKQRLERIRSYISEEGRKNEGGPVRLCCGEWRDQWAAESGICRVAHGVPDRVDRLKCLGNAVVPQQAFPILRAIAEAESRMCINSEE